MSDNGGTLGQRVVELRDRRGLTQRELADRAGISVSFLSGIENDKRNVSSEILLELATQLRTSLDYLMKGEVAMGRRPSLEDIPVPLARAAETQDWTYNEMLDVLEVSKIVVARRSGGSSAKEPDEWLEEDWITFRERLFDDGET